MKMSASFSKVGTLGRDDLKHPSHFIFFRVQNNPHSKMKTCSAREVIVALISILLVFVKNIEISDGKESNAFMTVSLACNHTRYPERCVSSMASYHETPNYVHNLTYVALQVSLHRARKARDFTRSLGKNAMNEKERVAWRDCLELFRDTIHHLRFCWRKGSISKDCPIWLSAALTSQQTCLNGFRDLNLSANSPIRALVSSRAVNLSQLVSNSLAMYKFGKSRNDRRHLSHVDSSGELYEDGFPEWVSARDRKLLRSSSLAREANVLVAQDGSGHHRKIRHAIKHAPRKSWKRYIIYIKAGIYKENIQISKKMRNLMLVGEGKHRTVVTGSRSVQDGFTTFRTATVGKSSE